MIQISMALLRDGLMLYDVSIIAIKQEDCYDTHAACIVHMLYDTDITGIIADDTYFIAMILNKSASYSMSPHGQSCN